MQPSYLSPQPVSHAYVYIAGILVAYSRSTPVVWRTNKRYITTYTLLYHTCSYNILLHHQLDDEAYNIILGNESTCV